MSELLTSAEAARMLRVGSTAVKRWADSGLLPCVRTPGGHRRFERETVERFLRAGSDPQAADDWGGWIELLLHDASPHELQARLLSERARHGAWHRTAAALNGLLEEIGRRWADGRLTVIEEHVASSALQRALAAVTDTIPVASDAPRCLLASAEGEEHTLGLSLVDLCLREAGWRGEWAGIRTRTSDVIDRVASGAVRMVALSASAASTDAAALARAAAAIGAACQAAGVTLVLGGSGAWPESPGFGVRLHTLGSFYQLALERRHAR